MITGALVTVALVLVLVMVAVLMASVGIVGITSGLSLSRGFKPMPPSLPDAPCNA
jgi:hypothetical protein